MNKQYVYGEAFMLMNYESADGTEKEVLWNSRDGITPFSISSRDGSKRMTHVAWHRDIRAPEHRPRQGDRIFVDATPELVREEAVKYVENQWENPERPMKEHSAFKTLGKAGAVQCFIDAWTKPGSPHVLTVHEEEGRKGA